MLTVAKVDHHQNQREQGSAFFLQLNSTKEIFYAPSDLERDEWVAALMKYSKQLSIDNAYEITRNSSQEFTMGKGADSRAHGRFLQRRTRHAALNSLLGSTGSLQIVYQGQERATGRAWAIKEIAKAGLHADDLSSLEVRARCAALHRAASADHRPLAIN